MVQFLIALWKLAQLVVFIITSLPTVIKALKQLWDMATDKTVAKDCVGDICSPEHLKMHVGKNGKKETPAIS